MPILGGSWVVISRVISMITRVITYIRGLITLLIFTHEPPSSAAVLCDMPLLMLTAASKVAMFMLNQANSTEPRQVMLSVGVVCVQIETRCP